MEHEIDKEVLAEELKKVFNLIDEQLSDIGDFSTRQVARRLRKIGERFVVLSKSVRRKGFTKK